MQRVRQVQKSIVDLKEAVYDKGPAEEIYSSNASFLSFLDSG